MSESVKYWPAECRFSKDRCGCKFGSDKLDKDCGDRNRTSENKVFPKSRFPKTKPRDKSFQNLIRFYIHLYIFWFIKFQCSCGVVLL